MAFHWRDGWFFERQPDGSVKIKQAGFGVDITIPASEWCSIIASVSELGETAETFEGAKKYHGA